MSQYIINAYLFVLACVSLHSYALKLHSLTMPIAYGLYFNLTWTSGGGDPTTILITSTNLNTTKSFLLANVNVSDGIVSTRIMPDTPASLSGLYSLRAVDSSNITCILDMLPPFSLSAVPTSVSSTEHQGSHSISLGPIIGGVVGSLAAMALLVTGFLIHRRRNRRSRSLAFRLPDFDERLSAQTQQGTLTRKAQVHVAMAEAQRPSRKTGSYPSSRAHNRLESLTITASVTSDDL